ncbi:MAG: alginate lyase family protein, partial [Anaerolineae bacterium]|nr:alginate lyase family protein [Anaerolineae bacterium]
PVRLPQAHWLTGDERYAREFAAEVEHWITANPWPRGVNWACTMEVAIRAINWLWAYHLVRGAGALTDAFERRLLASLLQHGRHILRNLENEEGFTNNHYLADLVGLIHLGVLCPWADEAVTWREVGLRELWAAVEHQVYPDGVYFEASIAYHRLALELILLAVALCRRNRMAVPEAVMTRLERMLEVVTSYTRPDGTAPAIGDADNGRILRLATWQDPGREWADHRYLLAIGAALLGRADLAQAAEGQWQEALWLLGPEAVARARARAEAQPALTPRSRAFPVGGLYVMRHRGLHLIVDAGGNAQNGFGGHAHNDTLSFELYAHGRSWIVDPGTYVYTADYRARDRFRSTAYHNIVVVDGQELNRFRKRSAFGLHEDADPRVNAWQSAADHDLLDASHRGYERLERPVLCRRQVYFSKEEGFWAVRDLLTGRGMHLLTLHLHLAQVETRLERGQAPTCLHLADGAAALDVYFLAPEGAAVSLGSGEVSRSYGVKSSAPVVSVSVRSALPVQFLLLLVPSRTTEPPLRWEQVRAMAARLPFGQPEESVRAHPSVPAPGLQPDALRYA